jgi:hypothetical protein
MIALASSRILEPGARLWKDCRPSTRNHQFIPKRSHTVTFTLSKSLLARFQIVIRDYPGLYESFGLARQTQRTERENLMHIPTVHRILLILVSTFCLSVVSANAAPNCPLSYGATDSAKSHKLFLYFPAADDTTFPGGTHHFDVAELTTGIGTTAALRDGVHDVVVDDFCEFNVQVLQTTTNPELLAAPPALRHTEAVGSDNAGGGAWGSSPTSNADVLTGHVWAGAYVTCEGGDGTGGCSMEGSLTGANNTLDHWAQAIGGTAAPQHTKAAIPTG